MIEDSPFVDCVRAFMRDTAGFYSLVKPEYTSLREAWKSGGTFYTGYTIDGDEVTLKLAEVEAVMFCTVASQQAAVDRLKAEERAQTSEGFE